MVTYILKKASEHIAARVPPALKHIIKAEVKSRNLADDSDFLKIAILNMAVSEESRRILREEMMDPMLHAMMKACCGHAFGPQGEMQVASVQSASPSAYILNDKPSAKPAAKHGKSAAAVAALKSKLAQMDAVTK